MCKTTLMHALLLSGFFFLTCATHAQATGFIATLPDQHHPLQLHQTVHHTPVADTMIALTPYLPDQDVPEVLPALQICPESFADFMPDFKGSKLLLPSLLGLMLLGIVLCFWLGKNART